MEAEFVDFEVPVAVGYEIDGEKLAPLLEQIRPGITKDVPVWKITAGVHYAIGARGVGKPNQKPNEELLEWHKKRRGKEPRAVVEKVWINAQGDMVAGEVLIGHDWIYAFFVNKNHKATSFQKKMISSSDQGWTEHKIPRTELLARPYLHVNRQWCRWKTVRDDQEKERRHKERLRMENVIKIE